MLDLCESCLEYVIGYVHLVGDFKEPLEYGLVGGISFPFFHLLDGLELFLLLLDDHAHHGLDEVLVEDVQGSDVQPL